MFKLRTLPFEASKNAIISEETCKFHYGKHHQGYVAKLNNLINDSEFKNANLFDIINKAKGALFNQAAQVYNHDFYWDCIAEKSKMSDEFKSALDENFDDFRSKFLAAATGLFGSGWCWLVYNLTNNKLEIVQTSNAETPFIDNKVPLLVVDVWEHAYYLDFQNARAEYLEKFYENINWKFVSDAFTWAKKEGLNSVKFYINEVHPKEECECCCK
ncbi:MULTISPECIES: superoxide dismutase [Campylobacter]|uniref:superoxide dismutase n=1 Tax=Campylobacter TaxID=194 RepID=UPI0023F18CB3|nr:MULTISPECIES: superoxide dismutase [Campylobacter]MCI6641356.1 superoxide dismutase [Campylobacter sp.]MDD7423302.1 superoxide dismutase [Campylobacter hominis]MDY3117730.1 superoxide dismutase [Campylobacter hominis]